MLQPDRPRTTPRIHAYAASFGDDFASELIDAATEDGGTVLDPFVGAGTTALESLLLNRNAIGIDVDPIACRISRVLTSRLDVQSLFSATEELLEKLRGLEDSLVSQPAVYQGLGPGSVFEIDSRVFRVPDVPAIAYWFDPSHMATLSIICEVVACEPDPLIRRAFEVAISSSIVRKWPNTLSYAMDIDHSRPHRPHALRPQPIADQFALFHRVLARVRDTIFSLQESLSLVESSASIHEGDAAEVLLALDSESIDFVLTSPPYLNAIDYPRAHKFSLWWLSPNAAPLGRGEYLGLRQAAVNSINRDCLSSFPELSESLAPFREMPVYRNISRYVLDLASVIDQLYRVAKARATVALVVADNVIAGTSFPVSQVIAYLLQRSGFSSVEATGRTIKSTRRRYPFGNNGFAGPMKNEYLVTGVKANS